MNSIYFPFISGFIFPVKFDPCSSFLHLMDEVVVDLNNRKEKKLFAQNDECDRTSEDHSKGNLLKRLSFGRSEASSGISLMQAR